MTKKAEKTKVKVNKPLLHQVVVAQMTNRRQGTSKVKNRHEVSGSTRKIYRQKGTGQARHGDIKAPIFVGGGRAFGPKPRNYEVRVPQKMRAQALLNALELRRNEGKFLMLDSFPFKKPKTKEAFQFFTKNSIPNALVVVEGTDSAAQKSIRNLEGFKVCRPEAVNVFDILKHKHLVFTKNAYEKFVSLREGKSHGAA